LASYQILTCESLTVVADPVSFTTDANGVAITGTINMAALNAVVEQPEGSAQTDNYADSAWHSLQSTEGSSTP
jgi:hypothetical protein